jgi:hypothetical protein
MKRLKSVSVFVGLSLLLAAGISWADSGGPSFAPLKVGSEAPWFVLPSSDERLVDYGQNYFGKHHLVITFFPAAFTPV